MSESDALRELARELYQQPRYADRPGLHRMYRLLPDGGWWAGVDAIKITGSNGKGTVATLTAEILRRLGLRVGLYTSPHLRFFNERIRIDGIPVGLKALNRAMAGLRLDLVAPLADPADPPLAFEATTALALRIFESENVDVIVAEAGIGGRHDATRRLHGSVNVLVSVDLEHTAILGDTEEKIAADKAELASRGSLLLIGELSKAARQAVESSCRRRSVAVEAPLDIQGLPERSTVHQRRNIALAAVACERWLAKNRPEINSGRAQAAIRGAVVGFQLPGRMQKIHDQPEIWIDIAHSPGALRAVADSVTRLKPERRLLVIFGVSKDKEPRVRSMVEAVESIADRFLCTCAGHRTGGVERVEQAVRKGGRPYDRMDDLQGALGLAMTRARAEDMRILVTGSLFLAVEAGEIVAGRDPSDLDLY